MTTMPDLSVSSKKCMRGAGGLPEPIRMCAAITTRLAGSTFLGTRNVRSASTHS